MERAGFIACPFHAGSTRTIHYYSKLEQMYCQVSKLTTLWGCAIETSGQLFYNFGSCESGGFPETWKPDLTHSHLSSSLGLQIHQQI